MNRGHTIRSELVAGAPGAVRATGGSCHILCLADGLRTSGDGGAIEVESINLTVTTSYQRIFAAATLVQVEAASPSGLGYARIEIVNYWYDSNSESHRNVVARTVVAGGYGACLTGTIDLPAGNHTIVLAVHPVELGFTVGMSASRLQVITGQTVPAPACSLPSLIEV